MFYLIDMSQPDKISISPMGKNIPHHLYDGIVLSIIGGEMEFLGRFKNVSDASWIVDNYGYNQSILRFCWGGESRNHRVAPDVFLDNIQRDYPADLNLFLFHPEIFQGVFHVNDL